VAHSRDPLDRGMTTIKDVYFIFTSILSQNTSPRLHAMSVSFGQFDLIYDNLDFIYSINSDLIKDYL